MRQFDNAELPLVSSSVADIMEFYHKLAVAAKPAKIDLIQSKSIDPECALWPSNYCSEIIPK